MQSNQELLAIAKANGGTVTYHFEDGTKTVSNLGKDVFLTDKGRDRSPDNVLEILNTIAHDMGATSFTL